jgi:hypothetical protein
MTERRLRFSLRSLFVVTTVIAVVVVMIARYPRVMLGSISIAFPFVLPAVVAYLKDRATIPARLFLAITGTCFIALSAMCWIDVKDISDNSDTIAIALMAGVGFFLFGIAWSIGPTKRAVPDEFGVKSNINRR